MPELAGELALVERLRRLAPPAPRSGLALGIGDDCAIYRPAGAREELLFTTDLLLEDVHFRRASHPADAVGHKALARGLSDIAAMGGVPRFCLVSLASPGDDRWIARFYRGLLKLAAETGVALAGGDLARSDRIGCDIVVCGAAPRGTALRRSGARAGDRVWVSGVLGGSALGLGTGRGRAWRRHLRPEPRLRLGAFLRRRRLATACMDLSDGLSLDLRRLCLASGLAASIEPPPLFAGASLAQGLDGGEDYELLFTSPPGARVPPRFEGLALTNIGVMRRGEPGEILLSGSPLAARGWDHFRQ